MQSVTKSIKYATPISLPIDHIMRILLLRAVGVVGQMTASAWVFYYLDLSLPLQPLAITLVILCLFSLATSFFLRGRSRVTEGTLFFQLMADVVFLTVVLYWTGGATNPFAWFLLVPQSLASSLLSYRYAWWMAFFTSLAYSLLVFFYQPLMYSHNMAGMAGQFSDHIMGMWIGFILSTNLMAYFVAGMADSLRKRNALLAAMNEQIFRDERLVALGSLAAGAAHELGTPLGTIDVLTHELARQAKKLNDEEMVDKMTLIQGQIKRCKGVLSSITKTAGDDKYNTGQVQAVDQYVENVLAQWQISHLDVMIEKYLIGPSPANKMVPELGLTHALINLLDNAAQASPEYVRITINWDDKDLFVTIEDKGKGMGKRELQQLGNPIASSKDMGLGIGIYLTKATIERMGGDINWENRVGGGISVMVRAPLGI